MPAKRGIDGTIRLLLLDRLERLSGGRCSRAVRSPRHPHHVDGPHLVDRSTHCLKLKNPAVVTTSCARYAHCLSEPTTPAHHKQKQNRRSPSPIASWSSTTSTSASSNRLTRHHQSFPTRLSRTPTTPPVPTASVAVPCALRSRVCCRVRCAATANKKMATPSCPSSLEPKPTLKPTKSCMPQPRCSHSAPSHSAIGVFGRPGSMASPTASKTNSCSSATP